MKTYNILLIDDEKEVCESLIDFASQIGIAKFDADIIITDRQNWQDGAELLEKEYFHALILDARCMIDNEQVDDNFDFLTIALERLKEIEQKQDRHIPFVINTGYFGEKEVQMMQRLITERRGKIFSKTLPKDGMFQYLVAEIEISENTKIEKEYADVFEIFDKGYLEASLRNDLLTIIKKLNDKANVKNNFNPLRKFIEAIYGKIKAKDTNLIPDAVYYGRGGIGINLEWTWRYLSGMSVNVDRTSLPFQTTALFSEHISKNVKTVEELSSTISHLYPKDVTTYAYKSAVFALLEILLWFKKLMDKP